MITTCPNRSSQEWVTLSNAVGELEAMRDYIETGEQIRTPAEVFAKLELRGRIPSTISTKDSPKVQLIKFKSDDPGPIREKEAIKLVDTLSARYPDLKITYQFQEGFEENVVRLSVDIKDGAQQTYDYFFKIDQEANSLLRLDPSEEPWYFRNDLQNEGFKEDMRIYNQNVETYQSLQASNPYLLRLAKQPISLDGNEMDQTDALSAISQLAEQISSQMGLPYEIITSQEATRLTSGRKNAWSGEAAFYMDGKVYFVGDKVTKEMVFHEFAHPLVQAIRIQNKALFNSLYDKLISTEEGKSLYERVKALYPELTLDSDAFKEELIVTALGQHASASEVKKSVGFTKFIMDLLFALKQQLRKLFGVKIQVQDLDENTSLVELAKMLKGDRFSLELSSFPAEESVVNYMRDLTQEVNSLEIVSDDVILESINKFYKTIINNLDNIQNTKNYGKMLDILVDEFEAGDLPQIRSNLSKYQTVLTKKVSKLRTDAEYTRARLEALVSSLYRMDKMSIKVHEELVRVSKDPNNVSNLNTVFYLNQLIDSWKLTVDSIRDGLTEEGVTPGSPMFTLLNKINTQIEQSKVYTDKVYTEGMTDVIHSQLVPMGQAIDQKYNGLIEYYEKERAEKLAAGKSTKGIDFMLNRYKAEYEKLKITPDKIKKLLKGELGDAGYFNSFFEGYLSNQDPIISGFGMFVNNHITDVMVSAQAKLNTFAAELEPLLKKAGYNPIDIAKLGKQLTFIDSIGVVDEATGLFTKKQVYTFLNPFKDYRHDIEQFHFDIKKAKEKFMETRSDEDYKEYLDKLRTFKRHLRDYFHQEFKDEFYETEDLFLKDDIGIEAKEKRDAILDKVQLLDVRQGDTEDPDITNEIDALWKEYRQMYSLLDLNGNRKTGKDLDIAKRLREHREISRDFYEWKERTGIFQNALNDYEISLIGKGYTRGTEEFEVKRREWIVNNTRRIIKPEFFVYRNMLLSELKDLLKDLPSTKADQVTMDEAYSDIFDSMSGYKDEDGQPKGSEIPEGRMKKIRERQEQLIRLRENWASFTGLTREEMDFVSSYFNRIEQAREGLADYPSSSDKQRVSELLAKKDKLGLSELKKTRVNAILAKLNALQAKEPTDYYLDIVNNYLDNMDGEMLTKIFGSTNIDKVTAKELLNYETAQKLMRANPEFKTWFLNNHIERKKFDPAVGEVLVYERLYAWSATVPTDKKFYESTDIYDTEGSLVETIDAKPTFKYYKRLVKPEFYNKRIPTGINPNTGQFEIGTVDNMAKRGYWLPKTLEQGAKDDRYRNQDYYDLKDNKQDLHSVLGKLIEYSLRNQEGVGGQGKLYLDIPRYRQSRLEALESWKGKRNPVTVYAKQARDFFVNAKDDWEKGYEMKEDEYSLVSTDIFDEQVKGIPIAGVYDLELDQVSLDLTHSLNRYMLSAEKQKKLIEINPVARALQQVMRDPKTGSYKALKDMTKMNKETWMTRNILKPLSKKSGENIRAKSIDNLIEREFQGVQHAGFTKNLKWLNQFSSVLFNRASFGFFALNIPSALKNSFGQMFQTSIEAAAGQYMNPKSYALGIGWASKAMPKISAEIYKKGPKSLDVQMVEIFDPALGRTEDKFGESMSRTLAKDAVSMSWLYNTRKWVELHATLSAFGGMMLKQKVKYTDKEGNTSEIAYLNAWELRDGQMELKEGIDPAWGKDGEKFKQFRNTLHEVGRRLNGVYDKFNQPEAQRYLLYRFVSYLNRYFTSMFINRWGFRGSTKNPMPRYNIASGELAEGYYITMIKSLTRGLRSGGASLAAMTPEEKRAFLKVSAEVAGIVILSMLSQVLFGWDPDDDDRYEKLRAKSGPLPFPFVPEDPDRPFNGWGWFENHALNLFMQVRAENDQWIPLPGLGLDDYQKRVNVTSVAFGPTIQTYGDMVTDVYHMVMGDPSAYYKREIGPYSWQKEGGSKFWAHLAKSMGLTGSTLAPDKAIKDFQSIQARNK